MCISASQPGAGRHRGVARARKRDKSRERDGEKQRLTDWQADRHRDQLQLQIEKQMQTEKGIEMEMQIQIQMLMQAQWLWALWTHHRHFIQKCKWLKCKWRVCARVGVQLSDSVWVWVWMGVQCSMLKCKAMLLVLRGSVRNKMFYILFILVKYSKLCVCLSVFVNTMPKLRARVCEWVCEWV